MTFDEILTQVLELLRRDGRVSYRALRRRFDLDEEYLEDLKVEIIQAKKLAVDEDGAVLVWTGGLATAPAPVSDQERPPLAYTPAYLAEKILALRAALEGERKQVTVLFADIKGSTELIEGLDPEEARRLLDPALHIMMEAVHRYEGTVNQVLGDGIMALFGAPVAHEGHAVRACYAALAMQVAMRRHTEEVRQSHVLEMQIRVGLNSGEVVVRAIGNDLHLIGVYGQAIAAAQRALALATAEGDVVLHALAHQFLGTAYEFQGDYRRAIDCFRQVLASFDGARYRQRFGQVNLPAVTSCIRLAECYAEMGTFAEGSALAAEGLRIAEEVDHLGSLIWAYYGSGMLCLLPLGEAYMLAGRLEEAHTLAERTLALAHEHQERGHESYALRLLGDIAAHHESPERDQAEAHYRQALTLADELGMRPLQAHCHRGLGTLYLKIGRPEQARAELSTAIALTRAKAITFRLPKVEAALAQVT